MKKLFVLLFVVLGYMPIMAYDFKVDGIYYNITSSTNLTVEVTYGPSSYPNTFECAYKGDVVIPMSVQYNGNTYSIIGIGDFSFYTSYSKNYTNYNRISARYDLESIELPSTIKSIGRYAFANCLSLKTPKLAACESIGSEAFENCTFQSLVLPKSISEIGLHAFRGSALKELIILVTTPPSIGEPWDGSYLGLSSIEVVVPQKFIYENESNWARYNLIEMVTPNCREFTYSGLAPEVSWTNNLQAYKMELTEPSITGKDAGNYSADVKADYFKNGELAFSAEFPFEYTINKAPLSVKANDVNREYGEDNPEFTNTYSGFVNNENESVIAAEPSIATTATKTSNVGEYPITISDGIAANYEFVYEPGVLTVTKAPLSARVNDTTKVYGTQNPTFTIEYYGLKNGETAPAWTTEPIFQTEATQGSSVGQYEVKAVNGMPVNYNLGEIMTGTISVTPAPLTVKANDATRKYYSDEPNFTYTCNGFVNGDNESAFSSTPVLSTSATQASRVGTYPISVSEVSSPNYSISRVNGTLTITPRTLVASVGNYERAYNEENPTFEVTYNGFVGNEDESVLHEKPIASTTAIRTSVVGTYPITVSGGDADNYQFSYTSGALTINKAEQEIVWEQNFENENYQVGDQVELQAYATSGLPINYVLSDNNIASLYSANGKAYLDCLQEGTLVIRTLQDGNNNYYAAVRKSKTLKIGDASGIETISVDALSSNAPVYDLMGNRIKLLIKGRIYIQNGKKFVAK